MSADRRPHVLAADDAERANVVVLSEAFWRTRFAADPGIVGQAFASTATRSRSSAWFRTEAELLAPVSIWASESIQGDAGGARGSYWLQTVARLKPGVSLEAAREISPGSRRISRASIPRRTKAAVWRSTRCATSCSAPS